MHRTIVQYLKNMRRHICQILSFRRIACFDIYFSIMTFVQSEKLRQYHILKFLKTTSTFLRRKKEIQKIYFNSFD
ncbi:hypothetical protein BpHYR1_005430 [Brachionus plicatilis]|uniref:Uncharacterized protein n=1 Tax=Brachionus plicatilis TaxID=10195 RepID=A0A3M7SK92_BRAPC|nr:hypothetical protein BpHYR1_005430 [Brachionus plicatilis]